MVSGNICIFRLEEQKRCGADIRESDDRFLVTGLWHGAGMTFVLWGVYYGVLQVIERLGFKKILGKYPVIGWSYTFLAALFGWVLFRADTFVQAGGMMVHDLSVEVFTDRCTFYKIL